MDVDNDLDGNLLQQFSCLNTTDREVLIKELQKLIGNQLNDEGCAFFLDMNNWNLQAAVCSYFDFETPRLVAEQERLPSMVFVRDVTIGEGEEIPPNTKFTKTWRIANSGQDQWPPGCCLRFMSGDQMCALDRVLVEQLAPGENTDVSVQMLSPVAPGIYQGQWRMTTPTGQLFGEVIWVIISVSEGGVLGLTQQMNGAFRELGITSLASGVQPGVTNNEIIGNSLLTNQANQRPTSLHNPFAATASPPSIAMNNSGNNGILPSLANITGAGDHHPIYQNAILREKSIAEYQTATTDKVDLPKILLQPRAVGSFNDITNNWDAGAGFGTSVGSGAGNGAGVVVLGAGLAPTGQTQTTNTLTTSITSSTSSNFNFNTSTSFSPSTPLSSLISLPPTVTNSQPQTVTSSASFVPSSLPPASTSEETSAATEDMLL